MPKRDLYATLGVDRTASSTDVKRAYRKRASKAHPDAGGDEKEFRELVLARDVLSDKEKRERYDTTGLVDGDDADRHRIAALNLIFDFTCEVVAKDPEANYLAGVRQMLVNSKNAAKERIASIDLAENRMNHAWQGAPEAKATILNGLQMTRSSIQNRMKLYDLAAAELRDANFVDTITPFANEEDAFLRLASLRWRRQNL